MRVRQAKTRLAQTGRRRRVRRGTVLVMIVGLLAMLFMVVSAYITLARFDRVTMRAVARGQEIEQILGSIVDVLEARIARTGAAGGEGYAAIPGYGETRWLSALDPVRDTGAYNPDAPGGYRYTGVTSLEPNATGLVSVNDLMRDYTADTYAVNVTPYGTPNADTLANARQPWMDADGEGIPDTSFVDVAAGTQIANSVTGRPVRVDGIDPRYLSDVLNDPSRVAWEQFNELARYEVALRIVSNGGKVLIGLPWVDPGATVWNPPWNREFMRGMFEYVRHPAQTTVPPGFPPQLIPAPAYVDRFDQATIGVSAAIGASEPILDRRGGLLNSGAGSEDLPPALRTLWTAYPNTFDPLYYEQGLRATNYQRFNVASASDWDVWRRAVSLDANAYNYDAAAGMPPQSIDSLVAYVRRRLLAGASFSDDLAREQDPNAGLSLWNPTSTIQPLGIDPGQPKFYLGRIRDAFNKVVTDPYFAYFDNRPDYGPALVREVAAYCYEMLSAYQFTAGDEAVTRARDQAFHLAVNIVQFAAPRRPYAAGIDDPGHVDCVWTWDDQNRDGQVNDREKVYLGYAPQPHITQVLAYRDDSDNVALAVELFNPHDSPADIAGGTLLPDNLNRALHLPHFAISTGAVDGGGVEIKRPLGAFGTWLQPTQVNNTYPRLYGRSFLRLIIDDVGSNQEFQGTVTTDRIVLNDLPVPATGSGGQPGTGDTITVKLWRKAPLGVQVGGWALPTNPWYLVDEFEIELEDPDEAWASAWRDTESEPYWGANASWGAARWRCVAAVPESAIKNDHGPGEPPATELNEFGLAGPGNPDGAGVPFGPTTPLCLMNASLIDFENAPHDYVHVRLHGAPRPPSYPTPGFLLFAPRYAHQYELFPTPGQPNARPAGYFVYEQWRKRGIAQLPITEALADLGHMPIFDNKQDVRSTSQFADGREGRVPWGLLVFDYFTTLDPDGPDGQRGTTDDIDICRIPGRINVNAAPWFVLAALPVIGPVANPGAALPAADPNGSLPIGFGYNQSNVRVATDASPGFWVADAGLMAGVAATTPRFGPQNVIQVPPQGSAQWYRLGAHAAQAVAAYRDRVPYVTPGQAVTNDLEYAEQRNGLARYRPRQYTRDSHSSEVYNLRGSEDDLSVVANSPNWKRGFLTLGELINVMGFDGSYYCDPPSASTLPAAENIARDMVNATTTVLYTGDFFRSVGLMALLDTHFLTTRSNTYTIYATLTDRQEPQASIRTQVTIDRGKLLPRLVWNDVYPTGAPNGIMDAYNPTTGTGDLYTTLEATGEPEIIGQREVSYFNARYDD